jgi:hypothetical protein
MIKQIQFLAGVTAFTTMLEFSLLFPATAQITEQEFQMGRARTACREQAEQQLLTVNSIVTTIPVSSGGQMIGSEVLLNVSRSGSTYDVRCDYDNASRVATISNLPNPGEGSASSVPAEGTFSGRGLASGSVFGNEREAEALLNFNQTNNFSFSLAVPPGTGAQVQYAGRITRIRRASSGGSHSFVLQGRVQSFASSANNLQVINATGTCDIEVFDARVISSSCNTRLRDSGTRFEGLLQF